MADAIRKLSLGAQLFQKLRSQIVLGEISPGSNLMPERHMALAEGVNRGAVREAIKRLAQCGLVESIHGGGNRVLDWRNTAGLDVLPALLVLPNGMPDHNLLSSMLELRVTLAMECCRGVVRSGNTSVVNELRAIIEQMEKRPKDLDWMQEQSQRYWDVMVDASGNPVFRMAFNSLRQVYAAFGPLLQHLQSDEIKHIGLYRSICDQIDKGDAEKVEKFARQLFELGMEQVRKAFRLQEQRQETNAMVGDLFA